MASLILKLMIPNLDVIPDLIVVSVFPRNIILISLEFSGQESVINHTGPLHPPWTKEAICMIKISLPFPSSQKKMSSWSKKQPSLLLMAFLCHPSSYKSLSFCTTSQSPSECQRGCFHKVIRSSNLLGCVLFFKHFFLKITL